ncbi:MAG: LytTR family transcriptional regulator [Bacteroidales bacterium]|jgi:hypothetical protein|nr:LytTR family transcriptional regulator [Bacteroidales bacterium]MCI1785432.1 LytTR family transcriptional regulator [Bacteroidales bacterium]
MGKNNKLPRYLLGKYQLIATVTFTAFFAIVFLLVSIPFSHNAWFALGNSVFFLFTLIFASASLLLVIFSKVLMYKTRNLFEMTYFQYVLWDIGEVVLIAFIYTFITIGVVKTPKYEFADIFGSALVYGTISIIIPYIIAGMYFAIIDKNNTIRLMNYSNVVSDEVIEPKDQEKISLFDNSGVLKLSVSSANLYYIESDDNYIKVWYTNSKGELTKYMLRCRLKTVEDSFKGSSLVRCHRQYIVNMKKVKVLRKEKDGYELDLDNDNIKPIAVTKTYAENVLKLFYMGKSGSPES